MSLLPDYAHQAASYDRTRSASPSVLAPLRAALGGAGHPPAGRGSATVLAWTKPARTGDPSARGRTRAARRYDRRR